MTNALSDRIGAARERMAAAAGRAGRDPAEVRLVAVTKTHLPELLRAARAAGLSDFGENRVQEAERKIEALADLRDTVVWHLIGHLQTNKARKAASLFDLVHSVDSLRLAEALDRAVQTRGQEGGTGGVEPEARLTVRSSSSLLPPSSLSPSLRLPVLLQVNVSGEASKEGFDLAGWEVRPALLDAFAAEVERIVTLPRLRVSGLMTIAPWGDDPELARPTFRSARRLREELARRLPTADWSELSMGMTDDFEVAIEEGATIVRIGRAIFGERETPQG